MAAQRRESAIRGVTTNPGIIASPRPRIYTARLAASGAGRDGARSLAALVWGAAVLLVLFGLRRIGDRSSALTS